jgi:hypothetical protein
LGPEIVKAIAMGAVEKLSLPKALDALPCRHLQDVRLFNNNRILPSAAELASGGNPKASLVET